MTIKDDARQFLFDLLNTPSPSGFEAEGQKKWVSYVRASADEVDCDAYGSAWATLRGSSGDAGPSVMIEAHADEIGYMVRFVTEEGFLHVTRIGGADRAVARGKRVDVLGSKGTVSGVIGITATHLRDSKDEKVPELHELYVDIGASSRDEVAELGVRVGHPVILADSVEERMPGKLTGRALDNRIGGFIIAEVFKRVAAGDRPAATLHAVNSVQEEIGGHGARMMAFRLHPSVCVVLDVTHATDSPGIDKTKFGEVKLGDGPTISHGHANHVKVVERLEQVAAAREIPLQHESVSLYTGTDTDGIFNVKTGVPSALVSLPMRYMHSPVETVDLRDIERCIDLLAAFVESVKKDDAFRIEV